MIQAPSAHTSRRLPHYQQVDDLKKAFAAAKKKYNVHRQRFTLPVPDGAPPKTRGTPLDAGRACQILLATS